VPPIVVRVDWDFTREKGAAPRGPAPYWWFCPNPEDLNPPPWGVPAPEISQNRSRASPALLVCNPKDVFWISENLLTS